VTDLPAALSHLPDEQSRRRVRHVVSENARVREVVALLRDGRSREIGPLLSASHASLRDDYQVTVAELDVAADVAIATGALGARMTGGGFGGCVIALVDVARIEPVTQAVETAFADRGFTAPVAFVAVPSPGVRRLI
jgi:galactokinase